MCVVSITVDEKGVTNAHVGILKSQRVGDTVVHPFHVKVHALCSNNPISTQQG